MTRLMNESLEFHEVDFSCTHEPVARRQFRVQVRGKDRYFLDFQALNFGAMTIISLPFCTLLLAIKITNRAKRPRDS